MIDEKTNLSAIGGKITYVQKKTKSMDVPYMLTAVGFKRLYLNDNEELELAELTPEEQAILKASMEGDPTRTPSNTLAAIFKARQIKQRYPDRESALHVCLEQLRKENQDLLAETASEYEKAKQLSQRADVLEQHLTVLEEAQEYERIEASVFAPLIHAKNRVVHFVKRKGPYKTPPHTEKEISYSQTIWEEFRAQQGTPENMSHREALHFFRYNSKEILTNPFDHVINHELLDAIYEEYKIYNIALQILDGSAYEATNPKPKPKVQHRRKQVEEIPHKNIFPYLESTPEPHDKPKSLVKKRSVSKIPEEPEF